MLFDEWLMRTRQLQIDSFDTDPAALAGSEHAEYVTWNFCALVVELGEMMQEYPTWKPWVTDRGSVIDRDKMAKEMVDVLHFAANILVSIGVTDEELTARYLAKMGVNAKRQEEGYDGVSTKDATGRATDEPEWTPMHGVGSQEERRAEEAAGRESVRHPATRKVPGGRREVWDTDRKVWVDHVTWLEQREAQEQA